MAVWIYPLLFQRVVVHNRNLCIYLLGLKLLSNIRNYCQNIITEIPSKRLLALDVMRGIAITGMVLVNNPGSWSYVYTPMGHAKWHGWTPTDLIFPFFLFMVGISIVLSFSKKTGNTTARFVLYKNIALRSLKLILLGLVLGYSYTKFYLPDYDFIESLSKKRIPGVLQRIGVVYFITAIIVLNFQIKGRIVWFVGLLISYWALMLYMPYSYIDANEVVHNLTGSLDIGKNFASYVDHHVFGLHIWKKHIQPFGHDPEGLLSTLPAIATCLSGVFTATLLKDTNTPIINKVITLLKFGVIAILIGQTLNIGFPINKPLWSPSYVFLTSGIALLFLALLIYIIDIKDKKLWSAPFIVFGANAIGFFALSTIIGGIFHAHLKVNDKSIVKYLFQM